MSGPQRASGGELERFRSAPQRARLAAMASADDNLFGDEHVRVYRETDGERGYEWRGTTILLLTTVGRKSGEQRTTPLIHRTDGGNWVIVASKGGTPEHPGWYQNLLGRTPRRRSRSRASGSPCAPRTAEGDERARLWSLMAEVWPDYDATRRRPTGRSRSSCSRGAERSVDARRGPAGLGSSARIRRGHVMDDDVARARQQRADLLAVAAIVGRGVMRAQRSLVCPATEQYQFAGLGGSEHAEAHAAGLAAGALGELVQQRPQFVLVSWPVRAARRTSTRLGLLTLVSSDTTTRVCSDRGRALSPTQRSSSGSASAPARIRASAGARRSRLVRA